MNRGGAPAVGGWRAAGREGSRHGVPRREGRWSS